MEFLLRTPEEDGFDIDSDVRSIPDWFASVQFLISYLEEPGCLATGVFDGLGLRNMWLGSEN